MIWWQKFAAQNLPLPLYGLSLQIELSNSPTLSKTNDYENQRLFKEA